jgi:hypothetical protein
MLETRNRNAWVWVAIAAIAIATLSRAESKLLNAKAFASPVLESLIKSHSLTPAPKSAALRTYHRVTRRQTATWSGASGIGAWSSILTLFFVGLVVPLSLLFATQIGSLDPVPPAPLVFASFQRPPPYSV